MGSFFNFFKVGLFKKFKSRSFEAKKLLAYALPRERATLSGEMTEVNAVGQSLRGSLARQSPSIAPVEMLSLRIPEGV